MAWSIWQTLKARGEARRRLRAELPDPTPVEPVPIPSARILREILELATTPCRDKRAGDEASEPLRKKAQVP